MKKEKIKKKIRGVIEADTKMHFYTKVFIKSVQQYVERHGVLQAAALSFYSIFSIGPILFLTLIITSFFFDAELVKKVIIENSGNYLGLESQKFFKTLLEKHQLFDTHTSGFYVSLLFVIISCLTIFDALQKIFSVIFQFPTESKQKVKDYIKFRLRSLLGSLIVGGSLLVFLMISSLIGFVFSVIPAKILSLFGIAAYLPLIVPFFMFSICISLLFKYLPQKAPSWKTCMTGAMVTTLAFHFTKSLVGIYLRNQGLQSVYSISGSVVVFLLWIFISSQILIFGAHLTNELFKAEKKK